MPEHFPGRIDAMRVVLPPMVKSTSSAMRFDVPMMLRTFTASSVEIIMSMVAPCRQASLASMDVPEQVILYGGKGVHLRQRQVLESRRVINDFGTAAFEDLPQWAVVSY